MTALLPPDPDTPALYWLRHESGEPDEVWEWIAADMIWRRGLDHTPAGLTRDGYTLASPHRIPTAEELDAVYDLVRYLESEAKDTHRLRDLYRPNGAGCKKWGAVASVYERAAGLLRKALGGTP